MLAIALAGSAAYMFNIDIGESLIGLFILFGAVALVSIISFVIAWSNFENINKWFKLWEMYLFVCNTNY